MDFAKSDIQAMLLDSAERLLSENADVEYWRHQRSSALGFDEARWAQFAELGWLALPVPEAAGGLDGTIEDIALLNIALGRALATEPYVSTVVLADHVLKQAADEAGSLELLGQIAGGTLRIALAHQENGAHPLDVEAGGTLARPSAGGYMLSGAKIMALDAPSAGQLIVSARMEGEEGTGLFLVPADAPGLSVESYALIDGTRASDIVLADVALPAGALLVGGNRGAAVLREAIDRASIALMAQAVGAMEAANKICGAYVQERKQFGAAIGSFQAIQHIMADNFVAAHQARSMLYHALANADQDQATRSAALSAARLVIGEAGQTVSRNGIQVHGGYGLTDEYAIGHYFRRLMCIEKQYGDLIQHGERFGDSIFG
ncbi:acyl-CoA dehydrogenase family protein [Sphingobium chlorophenolicum]|uniref:Acyl-CoA dehydrogenase domain-containing protein n=1 Tax=Sphingobium chlorophenolicum TaxID=46429 RepID=A0A081RDH4_SPHCR|nr:acyl-CoA dehydrogenase family protein [Sphingobium chlorophenolicum]KEQ53247.1 Acyl-CoA dehydrogenase domain-containing protein [Sphingobium chlorophenolicum]